MLSSQVRTSVTSKGVHSFTAWNYGGYSYSLGQINLGSNPISGLEVVSALNLFNYGPYTWWYDERKATQKYNPKVYLGAVQSVSKYWQIESHSDLPGGSEKSGSLILFKF